MKRLKVFFIPETEKSTNYEIDCSNLRSIFWVSLIVTCVQLIALTVFIITNFGELNDAGNSAQVVSVGSIIIILVVSLLFSWRLNKAPDFIMSHHPLVNGIVIVYCVIVLIWGMLASMRVYVIDHQIITFYTVELCVVIFVKLKPWASTAILLGSYLIYFAFLEPFIKHGMINPYNYLMLALLSVAGAGINYHLTVGNVEKKNRIESLNDSLQMIATHDSLTRLLNRYALNNDIPGWLNADICIAMGDINKFKQINDRFGHQMGDIILRHVSDVLLTQFPKESVYRYGGDEFLIICRNDSEEEFQRKLDAVNEHMAKYRIKDSDMKIRCSFGFVRSSADNTGELISLISRADKKLYEQKS